MLTPSKAAQGFSFNCIRDKSHETKRSDKKRIKSDEKQIERGDITFFIYKDYSQDLVYANNPDKIIESIDRLRMPIKAMNAEEQAKTMKYIQNLTKLSSIYESTF